MTDVRIL